MSHISILTWIKNSPATAGTGYTGGNGGANTGAKSTGTQPPIAGPVRRGQLVKNKKAPPRIELGLPESEPDVITNYTKEPTDAFLCVIKIYNPFFMYLFKVLQHTSLFPNQLML